MPNDIEVKTADANTVASLSLKKGKAVVELFHDSQGHITGVKVKRGTLSNSELLQLFTSPTLTNPLPSLNWYDRNPITATLTYTSGFLGPHALTTRSWTTLQNPKKKILVLGADLFVQRYSADSVGTAISGINAVVDDGVVATARIFDNTALAKDHITIGGILGILNQGESLIINTFSGDSGDGQLLMYGRIPYVYFDA